MDMEDIREKYRKVTNEKKDRSSESYLKLETFSKSNTFIHGKTIGTLDDLINVSEIKNKDITPVPIKKHSNSISKNSTRDESLKKKLNEKEDFSFAYLNPALKDEDSKIRRRAVYFLGEIGGLKILNPLKQMLDDKDHSVRRAVAKSLGKVGNYEAMYMAIGLLEDENSLVRETAAVVLGKIGNKNAIEHLKKAKQDENILVNMAAAKAIQEIKDSYISN